MFEPIIVLFNTVFVHPLTNLLIIVYNTLVLLGVPYALGFSIILVTVIIRLLIYPFSKKQIESSKKMQDVAPQLNVLKDKYKDDAKMLQSETMRIYKENGINPFGSCLPTILQIVVFIALYQVFLVFLGSDPSQVVSKLNSVVYSQTLRVETISDTTFFGIPLVSSPSKLFSTMPFLILIPIITAGLQLLQAKMMFPTQKQQDDKKALVKKKDAKKNDEPDFQSVMQKQMIFLIPVSIGIAAYSFPLGLSLYWNTMTIFGMIQQYQISGIGGLSDWIKKIRPEAK